MVRLENIQVVRDGRAIIDGIDLTFAAGQIIGIVGPNGAGKTTLLRVIAGLLRPDAGTITIDGRDGSQWRRRDLARHVAYLPQHPECRWAMTVERVVALGRLPHLAAWQRPGESDRHAIRTAMQDTDVVHLGHRRAGTLSGGELARVMLARSLASAPSLLLADEPVADLDPYHSLDVMDHLTRMAQEGRTVVVVLHDLTLAARYCARVALLDRGRIVADGPPDEALSSDNLARVYRIAALHGSRDGKSYLLPWSRLPGPRRPGQGGPP